MPAIFVTFLSPNVVFQGSQLGVRDAKGRSPSDLARGQEIRDVKSPFRLCLSQPVARRGTDSFSILFFFPTDFNAA